MTRCKVDDLVRYIGLTPRPNKFGWVGRVIRFEPDRHGRPAWIVDPPLPGGTILFMDGYRAGDWVFDEHLRPLRDNDGEDESLSWADKPIPCEVQHG